MPCRPSARPAHLVVLLSFAALAGCSEPLTPDAALHRPQFAQGDGGIWTVTSLDDPGEGACDEHCTLREAIADAGSGDQIVFASELNGTIELQDGELEIIEKSLSIDGDGRITIDAAEASGVLLIADYAESGTMVVTLTDLVLENGAAPQGGGINTHYTTLNLARVTLSNHAAGTGGGIRISGGALHVADSRLVGNRAGVGAAIAISEATVEIVGSTIADNTAEVWGGGIWVDFSSTATITETTISGNQGSQGGGIFLSSSTLRLIRSTVSGNTSTTDELGVSGGGLAVHTGTLEVVSSTITGNAATQDGQNLDTNVGSTSLVNSIIGGGAGAAASCRYLGPVTSGGFNLVNTDCAPPLPQPTDIIVTDAQMYTQVLDAVLADNGGPTETHALFATGLAVDAGFCPSESADQRGFARPVDLAAANAADGCDIGAYEAQAAQTALADLVISQAVDRTSVKQGDRLTYTVRVRNLGPDAASNVIVSNVLSSGVTFVEARATRGTTTGPLPGETGTVTWLLGEMQDGDDEHTELTVTVLVRGRTTITNVASVSADTSDPVEGNNSAAITVSVAAGSGGGSKGGGNGGKGTGSNK